MEDKEIVERILSGDTEQYALIVRRYQQIVANLTYKLCGTRLDVEEVTQQVFVELYMALPRFRFDSKLSSFIYRITVNVVCKMMNKSKRFVSSDELENPPELVASDRNAEQQIIHNEQMDALRTAIGHLKDEQRTALILYSFEDFSYNQIAEAMGCSLAKVESLIFRAKKNLAKELKNNTLKHLSNRTIKQ